MPEHAYYTQYNTSAFDEPFYAGKPMRVLIMASTPRVGSTLLTRGLMSLDAIAATTEFLNPVHRNDFEARWGVLSDHAYLERLMQYRTKANGLFAVKAHYNNFALYEQYLQSYNLDFVFIQRKDRVRQAVSWFKADLTQAWSSEKMPQKQLAESDYSFHAIYIKFEEINTLYQQWEEYFSIHGHIPERIYYEDLDRNYNEVLSHIANTRLGMSVALNSIPATSLTKQCDVLTEYYVSRFHADQKQGKAANKLTRQARLQAWVQKIFCRH
jgi:LPS sulfotransferase NodH